MWPGGWRLRSLSFAVVREGGKGDRKPRGLAIFTLLLVAIEGKKGEESSDGFAAKTKGEETKPMGTRTTIGPVITRMLREGAMFQVLLHRGEGRSRESGTNVFALYDH